MNIEWAEMIVKELIKQGVRRFCIAYGNRSTPLVLAAAHHPLAKTFTHFDERGLGFFALGIAKALSEPVALIVTSGTALGNLYPAVMEAFHSQIPLIILSADRPSDLKETSANQSCSQSNFFGNFSRFFYEFPNPQLNFSNYFIQGMIAQSVHRSRFPIKGPVHINCPFQEPFFDKEMPELFTTPHSIDYITPRYSLNIEDFSYLLEQIDLYDEGIIIIGSDQETIDLNSVVQLSKHLNFPIFAEVHSNLRIKNTESIITYPILTLKHSKKFNCKSPKIILQIGEKLISNEFLNLKTSKDVECIIQISNYPFKNDPDHKTNFKVVSDISEFSKLACDALEKKPFSDYFQKWSFASKKIAQSIDIVLDKAENLNEPIISLLLSNIMENEVNFFISNSMPIRFMNDFFHSNTQRSFIFTNRGLSGIDGNIATAIGIQKELETPLICLIGDLATLHDLNSFQLLDKNQKILFVICNNFGGQIFKKVEVSKFQNKEILDNFFIGSHKNNFDNIAKMFSIPFLKIQTIDEFSFGLGQFFDQKSSMILELILDPQENEVFLELFDKELQLTQSNNTIKSYFFSND